MAGAAPATAQEWFPGFDFHLDSQYVTSGDPRFNWMFDFGGDLEVLRAAGARALLVANFEAIAGEQFRRFDVNQGNYLIEGAVLFRAGGVEFGPVWHHVSRHLSDRPKRTPIDWNMLALRARAERALGRAEIAGRIDGRATVTSSFVDYDWEVEGFADGAYRLSSRFVLVGRGTARVVGVDGSRARGTQTGGGVEAGVRFDGTGAAAEVFAGVERRIDPYPLEFGRHTWFLAGLRLSSR